MGHPVQETPCHKESPVTTAPKQIRGNGPVCDDRDGPSTVEELREKLLKAESDLLQEREERRRVEAALRESREYYRNLFEYSPTAHWLQDFSEVKRELDQMRQSGVHDFRAYFEAHPNEVDRLAELVKIVRVNSAAVKLYGGRCEADLLPGLKLFKPPQSDRDFMKQLAAFSEGATVYESETTNLNLKGELIHIHIRKVVVSGCEEDLSRVMVSITDITDRKLAEQALRESEETARTVLNVLTDSALLLDSAGRILLLNKNAAAMLGKEVPEVLGGCLDDHVPQMFGEAIRESLDRTLSGKVSVHYENQWQGRTYDTSIHPVMNAQGEVTRLAIFARDITERKELEEERIRSGKLEAIGQLAGGIAHDFNNILTIVLGNIELAQLHAQDAKMVVTHLDDARNATFRAKDLSHQLVTFSKGGEPIKRLMPITRVIQDSMAFASTGSNVKCTLEVCPDVWDVVADESQIHQVLNNMILNAVQAMPEGGRISIGVENVESNTDPSGFLKSGRYVRITLRDEGHGIKPEHLTRIFDPYFTTKPWGTGLGLATVYSIVKRHEGHILVQSRPDSGATFEIFLPAAPMTEAGVSSTSPKTLSESSPRRVLVMDDEEMLRRLSENILQYLGYEVELAGDGSEAVDLYVQAAAKGRPFDVLILDLTIPGGRGGKEVLKQLKEIDPEVRAIVCSGYHSDPVMSRYGEYGFRGVVAKPYDIEEMRRVLLEVLKD